MAGDAAASQGSPRGEITKHLRAWSAGDDRAGAAAFAALYDRLRLLAGRALRAERTHHTLGNAGLVSEVFFRMMEQRRVEWRSREQFIATAARMMRRILVDYARGHGAAKRGRGVVVLPVAEVEVPSDVLDELVPIHDALEALAALDPAHSEIVELRFFGGMTHDEIAACLGVSLATVERRWRLARAWLYRHLKGVPGAPG